MTRIQVVVCGGVLWCLPMLVLGAQQTTAMPAPVAQQTPVQPAATPVQPVSLSAAPSPSTPSSQDVFSYSYLQINRLSEQMYNFGSRSAGNGVRFSWDFPDQVYLFGEWNRLDFDRMPGSHDLTGIGVGAHQQYSSSTSFYVNLSYLRDALSGSLGGARDYYWRLSYGFQSHLSSFIGLTAAIFTERNTDFGRRPFGERLGLIFGGNVVGLTVAAEHTHNGNRLQAALNWYYK